MKKISLFLVLALLLGMLAGCGAYGFPFFGGEGGTAGGRNVHPLLFHITGPEGQESWLFGTIHVGDKRIDTAVEKIEPYLDACDALAVEFDIVAYEKDAAAQKAGMDAFLLTDGTKITDHMPAETYEKAAALLKEAGVSPELMQGYDLALWSQLAEQAAIMTKTDFDLESGVDRTLIHYCYERQIEVRDVESAELQYGLLAGFPDELNLLMLENTLNSLGVYKLSMNLLYNAWLRGNADTLEGLLNSESGSGTTEEESALLNDYYDAMLTQRNLGMRDKLVEWLEAGDKVFFAVGTAHLLGEDGLAELLRAAGYTVEQISYGG